MKSKDGQKFSAGKRIEQALLAEISQGKLAPGKRLDEAGLAERFGASRTPVREALSRLTCMKLRPLAPELRHKGLIYCPSNSASARARFAPRNSLRLRICWPLHKAIAI